MPVQGGGDANRGGRADILVGAPASDAGGLDSGRAYVFSGHTYKLIRTLHAGDAGDLFGSATDPIHDLNGDRIPELVVGAQDTGPTEGDAAYVSGRNGRPLVHPAPPSGIELGSFVVADVGDVNGDGTGDVYAADSADGSLGPGTGCAAAHSSVDGSELHAWVGSAAGEGLGPGREAGDVTATVPSTLPSAPTRRATGRLSGQGGDPSPARTARSCGGSPARGRSRTSGSAP